jgi:hypothetical protein
MANLFVAKLAGADGFEKRVAVKVIHEHLVTDPEFVKMFIDEARIASRVAHPNVVQTIELGRFENTHFIAMEYVDGESLNAVLRRSPLSAAFCARIIADAAAGLHAAHELRGHDGELLGVVHRDVSPQNILISYDGIVKVVDFGVARARGRLHTTSGALKGKVSYMAPEQIETPTEVDRRADIFALGIVLYEATTRRRLITGDNEAVKIKKLISCGFPPPSAVAPGYSPTLEQIVMRALARDPDERFATAQQMYEALERFIISSGEPVLQSRLAAFMRSLFADRIIKKQEVDAQADPESSAVFEADLVSLVGRRPMSASTTLPRRRIGTIAALVVSGLMLAVASVAVVLAYRANKVTAAAAARPAAGVSPDGRVVAAPAPTPDATARRIRIAIRATPATASVLFDGKLVSNPFELELAPGEGAVEAVVSAPRHRPQRIRVPMDSGGEWTVRLQRARRPARGSRTAGKPGDLKDEDVFSNPYKKRKRR